MGALRVLEITAGALFFSAVFFWVGREFLEVVDVGHISETIKTEIAFDLDVRKSFSIPAGPGVNLSSTAWVKVLTIIDHETLTLHENKANAEIYFLKFWKNVDKYTKLLDRPTVRISFSGLSVLNSSFLNENRTIDGKINSKIALESLESYVSPLPKNSSHDLVVVFTKQNLYHNKTENSTMKVATQTMALMGEISCNKSGLAESRALIKEDTATWTGIKNTLFVIGRFLGAEEDGSGEAKSCERGTGIMNSTTSLETPFRKWTNCSHASIHSFMNNEIERTACLFNRPSNIEGLIKIYNSSLPGETGNLDDYCRGVSSKNTKHCSENESTAAIYCTKVRCERTLPGVIWDSKVCEATTWGPAPEGSSCYPPWRCSYGRCVDKEIYAQENAD